MTQRVLQMFPSQNSFDAIMAALDADGGVIVRDFVAPDLLSRLNAQLEADVDETDPGSEYVREERRRFWGSQTKRLSRLAARAPAFVELLDHEFMHRWARHTLAADYWLNTGQAMIVGPGEKAQVLHRDIGIWPFIQKMGTAAPEVMVSILLALSDFTEEIGATRVIPGSHRWEDFMRTPQREDTVAAVMPAGSALLYLGKTVHGAGANVTGIGLAARLAFELRTWLVDTGRSIADMRSMGTGTQLLAPSSADVGGMPRRAQVQMNRRAIGWWTLSMCASISAWADESGRAALPSGGW